MLALLQGVTEMLPVSSSGHLVLARHAFGLKTPAAALEVVLHVGTLLAVLAYYRKRIARLVADGRGGSPEAWRFLGLVLLGCVPAAVVGLLWRRQMEALFAAPLAVCLALCVSGGVLLGLRWVGGGSNPLSRKRALIIGLLQVVALVPGISRSGLTMATARYLGVPAREAAEFSFLMSVPLVLGALGLELAAHGGQLLTVAPPAVLLVGVLVSAVAGYAALHLAVRSLASGRLWVFGIYLGLVGATGLLILG